MVRLLYICERLLKDYIQFHHPFLKNKLKYFHQNHANGKQRYSELSPLQKEFRCNEQKIALKKKIERSDNLIKLSYGPDFIFVFPSC